MLPNFQITEGKGFQIKLPNGWTVSVQFGKYNYCNNRDQLNQNHIGVCCKNAEIAVIGDGVEEPEGWQSPAQFLEIINAVAARPQFVPKEPDDETA